jgi:hypothetical protein
MTLGEYLHSLGGRRRQWCVHDCATLPCDWAIVCGWPDPMAAWRGAYEADADARALIDAEGGLLPYFERAFAAVPVRDGEARAGDVGVLSMHGAEAGAIFTGERWAFVGERGIGFASVPARAVLKAWAVRRG